jgi:hypothetical protein
MTSFATEEMVNSSTSVLDVHLNYPLRGFFRFNHGWRWRARWLSILDGRFAYPYQNVLEERSKRLVKMRFK